MKYLLDTQALIWFINADAKLSEKAKEIIENQDNTLFISIISFWEMAIKLKKGKLNLAVPLQSIIESIETSEMQILPILSETTLILEKLEEYHKDPFDRMLIAQAMLEKTPIISVDENFKFYDIQVIW